ncbi:MAG: major tail protein [Anaerolineaceae bacterium]
MSKNKAEYNSRVGVDQVYVAEVLQDDAAAYSAATPEWLAPAALVSQEPSGSIETQYADDQPYDVSQSEGATKVTLEITGLPPEVQAKLTGSKFDATTGRVYDNAGVPPFYALGFRSMKSNGKYRYFWFLRGKFNKPKEESATKGEKPEPKSLTLEFTALKTVHPFTVAAGVNDTVKRLFGDEDTDAFSATGWFTQVQVPGITTPDALALSSSVPTAGASGASKTANLTLTFNNALAVDAINGITLLDATPATVSITAALDATKKIVTITHAALAGTTAHTLVYAVTDIYGQTLNGIVKFTTAA